jgi:integral membrane protein (TIGR01906 family)
MTDDESPAQRAYQFPIYRLVQILVAVALPLVLLIGNVQLLMHERFVRYEYNKPGFPPDTEVAPGSYALDKTERTALARVALDSVAGPGGMRVLEEARFQKTGAAAFNPREIRHMRDVRVVFQQARMVFWVALVVLVGGLTLLGRRRGRRAALRLLVSSVTVALSVAVTLGLYILLNFRRFFTQFHHVFFEGDTWLFRSDDTLIRLFPTDFWSDAALIIAGLTAAELLLVGVGAWWWGRRSMDAEEL